MTTVIILEKRSHDWHACLNGDRTLWGCGKSQAEAIGDVVRTHADKLGIVIAHHTLAQEPRPCPPGS